VNRELHRDKNEAMDKMRRKEGKSMCREQGNRRTLRGDRGRLARWRRGVALRQWEDLLLYVHVDGLLHEQRGDLQRRRGGAARENWSEGAGRRANLGILVLEASGLDLGAVDRERVVVEQFLREEGREGGLSDADRLRRREQEEGRRGRVGEDGSQTVHISLHGSQCLWFTCSTADDMPIRAIVDIAVPTKPVSMWKRPPRMSLILPWSAVSTVEEQRMCEEDTGEEKKDQSASYQQD
jgi:hypothetical protein